VNYPFSRIPRKEEIMKIAPGVFWFRLAMPYTLNHINVWLLEGKSSWTVVDSGPARDESRKAWQLVIEKYLSRKPIAQVLCTHMHPDHLGLVGWLCRREHAGLWMSQHEFNDFQIIQSEIESGDYQVARQFYRAAGVAECLLDHYAAEIGHFVSLVDPLPFDYRHLHDGEMLSLSDHQWQVVAGQGHSVDHLCFLNEEQGLFISGDQLLPEISSNISVWPRDSDANPLAEWQTSCLRMRETLDDNILVLPSHGRPFKHAVHRLASLADEVESNIERLYTFCKQPRRLIDMFSILFVAEITPDNLLLACGEARAYCNYLLAEHKFASEIDADGVVWYQQFS